MALLCGFRGFWFKSLNTHPYLFFCNISLFGKIFAHFLAVSQKNKTSGKISEGPKKRVAMRIARKKRITFAWYTKVIPQVAKTGEKVHIRGDFKVRNSKSTPPSQRNSKSTPFSRRVLFALLYAVYASISSSTSLISPLIQID